MTKDSELHTCRNFADLNARNYDVYPMVKAMVDKHGKKALEKLYKRIGQDATTSQLLPNQQIRDHAANAQQAHWNHLFTNQFDDNQVNRSEGIGKVHSRVGLTPAYYIGGYAIVLEEIIEKALTSNVFRRLSGKRLSRAITAIVGRFKLERRKDLRPPKDGGYQQNVTVRTAQPETGEYSMPMRKVR